MVSPKIYRLVSHSWGIGIALLMVWACVTFFLIPDSGSMAVRHQFGAWDSVYYALYGVAGICILAGLVGRHRCEALEAFGLCIFLAGVCINMAAIVATIGVQHSIDNLGGFLAYALGATGRLLLVTRTVRKRPVVIRDLDTAKELL